MRGSPPLKETLAPALASDVANKHQMLQIGHDLSQFGNFEDFTAELESFDCVDCRITQIEVATGREEVSCGVGFCLISCNNLILGRIH